MKPRKKIRSVTLTEPGKQPVQIYNGSGQLEGIIFNYYGYAEFLTANSGFNKKLKNKPKNNHLHIIEIEPGAKGDYLLDIDADGIMSRITFTPDLNTFTASHLGVFWTPDWLDNYYSFDKDGCTGAFWGPLMSMCERRKVADYLERRYSLPAGALLDAHGDFDKVKANALIDTLWNYGTVPGGNLATPDEPAYIAKLGASPPDAKMFSAVNQAEHFCKECDCCILC